MTTNAPKLNKESIKDPFRPKFCVDDVARISHTLDHVNYDYKLVIYNYKKNPQLVRNVEEHEKSGFEIVYSTEHIEDDRKFAPTKGNTNEDSLKPRPVLKTTSDGYEEVLTRRLKTDALKYAKEQNAKTEAKYSRKQRSVRNKNGSVHTDGGEFDISKNNASGDE